MAKADTVVIAALVAAVSLLGCRRGHYSYEAINDSPDNLSGVLIVDPNFTFMAIDMDPYDGGKRVSVDGQPPETVEVRWTRRGQPAKSVRVDTGLDCPGRPTLKLSTMQYWIRADDSIRTRFTLDDPSRGAVDFIPCESDAEKVRRLANEALEQAATAGDISRIEAALKNAALNPEGYFDPAPLHLATMEGHLPAVEYLVKRGARIEIPQRLYSQSALVVAIEQGHLAIAELLINSGADLNMRSSNHTPLLKASEKGHLALVDLLLNRGADIALDAYGQSALINAAREGHLPVVDLLLEKGADPNTTIGGTSATALDIAEQFQHAAVAALLIRHGAKRGPPR